MFKNTQVCKEIYSRYWTNYKISSQPSEPFQCYGNYKQVRYRDIYRLNVRHNLPVFTQCLKILFQLRSVTKKEDLFTYTLQSPSRIIELDIWSSRFIECESTFDFQWMTEICPVKSLLVIRCHITKIQRGMFLVNMSHTEMIARLFRRGMGLVRYTTWVKRKQI